MSSRQDRGSFLVFVTAVVLPAMFFLFSIIADLSRYYLENQSVQHGLDEAGIFAYRFLPDQAAAQVAAVSYFSKQFPQYATMVQVGVTPDTITLGLQAQVPFHFASFFNADIGIPFSASTRVKGTPVEAFVVLDASSYLSPSITGDAPWGDELTWGPARYFSELNPTPGFETPEEQRVLTQQCFNPVFSRLKTAALMAYDRLKTFSLNSVGLASLPGPTNQFQLAREVVLSPLSVNDQGYELEFEHYNPYHFQGDLACAAAAEQEQNFGHYRFPIESSNPGLPSPRIIPGNWEMAPEYPATIQGPEYIWMQPTNSDRNLDFLAALDLVEAELLSAKTHDERAGLIDRAVKTGVLFLGDLPRTQGQRYPDQLVVSEVTSRLERFREALISHAMRARLYVVLLRSESADYIQISDESVSSLRSYLEAHSETDQDGIGLTVKLLSSTSEEELVDTITALLLIDRKTSVVAL